MWVIRVSVIVDCIATSDATEDVRPVDLTSALKNLAPRSGVKKRVTVNREYLFTDSISEFKTAKFDFNEPFRVTFENESALDGGGRRREYFSLLLKELVSPYAVLRLFEGNENNLLPMHNTDALCSSLFKVAGRMITSSIINGGPAFPCLAVPVYTYLVTGAVNEAVECSTADDIPDFEVREALKQVCSHLK